MLCQSPSDLSQKDHQNKAKGIVGVNCIEHFQSHLPEVWDFQGREFTTTVP